MTTTKNGAVTPAAYVAPSIELVEMGVESAILGASTLEGGSLNPYDTDTWN